MSGIIMKQEPIPPNPDMLAIVRLHLERLPIMTDEEREMFLRVTSLMIAPPMLITRLADAGESQ